MPGFLFKATEEELDRWKGMAITAGVSLGELIRSRLDGRNPSRPKVTKTPRLKLPPPTPEQIEAFADKVRNVCERCRRVGTRPNCERCEALNDSLERLPRAGDTRPSDSVPSGTGIPDSDRPLPGGGEDPGRNPEPVQGSEPGVLETANVDGVGFPGLEESRGPENGASPGDCPF